MSCSSSGSNRVKSICVFCGSRPGADPAYAEAAGSLGRTLAKNGITLVYGGGHVGLMDVVADTIRACGSRLRTMRDRATLCSVPISCGRHHVGYGLLRIYLTGRWVNKPGALLRIAPPHAVYHLLRLGRELIEVASHTSDAYSHRLTVHVLQDNYMPLISLLQGYPTRTA